MTNLEIKNGLKNPWVIFWVTSFGAGMASIDSGVVNVALPTITQQFHSQISFSQWTISGYLLMLCVWLPLCGRLSDIYTRKLMYLVGFIVFTVTSAFCGAAHTLTQLIIFRFIQGLGAALIIANNQAIIMSNFPREKQGYALSINSMLVAIGSLTGPTIGGFLIGAFGWPSIFYVNLPVGLIGCILGYKILPRETRRHGEKFDTWGAIFFAVGMFCFLLTLNNADNWGYLSLKTSLFFAFSLFILIYFYFWEKQTEFPMIDFSLFKNWLFFSGNFVGFIMFLSLAFNTTLLPFYLQEQLNLSPQVVGLFLLIPPLFILIFSPISGRLINRTPLSKLTIFGIIIMIIGLITQALHTRQVGLWEVALAQSLLGIGYGIFQSPNNYSILANVPTEKLGLGTGLGSLIRNIGRICGVVLSVAIFNSVQQQVKHFYTRPDQNSVAFLAGFKVALLCAALIAIAAILLAHKRSNAVDNME